VPSTVTPPFSPRVGAALVAVPPGREQPSRLCETPTTPCQNVIFLDSLGSQANAAIEHEVIAGAVGTGAATEFPAFLRMFRELPNIDAILLNPTQEPVPENAAAQYAVASGLARCASGTNFDRICLYLNRLPTEFRVLCVRDATLRAPGIRCTAGYTKWAVENHHAIA